jgi:hypothetical protein
MRFIYIVSRALTRARPGYARLGAPDKRSVSNRAISLVLCKRLVKSVLSKVVAGLEKIVLWNFCISGCRRIAVSHCISFAGCVKSFSGVMQQYWLLHGKSTGALSA